MDIVFREEDCCSVLSRPRVSAGHQLWSGSAESMDAGPRTSFEVRIPIEPFCISVRNSDIANTPTSYPSQYTSNSEEETLEESPEAERAMVAFAPAPMP
jgi:hypothetical protein